MYPLNMANASELLKNLQKPLSFKLKLEEKLYSPTEVQSVQSPMFLEGAELEGFSDWLSIFENSEEAFMSGRSEIGVDVVQQ